MRFKRALAMFVKYSELKEIKMRFLKSFIRFCRIKSCPAIRSFGELNQIIWKFDKGLGSFGILTFESLFLPFWIWQNLSLLT